MLTKPENIKFESHEDIVDYISKGLPPTKNNYDKIVDKILYSDSNDTPDSKIDLIVRERLFNDIDKPTFVNTLDRVYTNRLKNLNNLLITASIGIGTFILGKLLKRH